MTTIILLLTIAALIGVLIENRRLAEQIAAINDRQAETEIRLDKLGKRSRKQTNTAKRHEQKIERLHRKQREQAARQDRIEKEQKKQAETLSKVQFKLSQSLADIEAAQDRLTSLFAILDCIKAQQAETIPGSAADVRLARQAVVLESQISAAERKLAKAQFEAAEAREKIAA